MRTKMSVALGLCALTVLVGATAGCGSGGGTKMDEGYMKSAASTGADVKTMFDKSGGDYSKLSDDEKKRYVQSFAGDEKKASEFWEKLKSGSFDNSRPAAQ